MFRFACPNCKSALRTNDTSHGAIIACPGCTQRMRIPYQPGTAADVSQEPAAAQVLAACLAQFLCEIHESHSVNVQ